MTKVLVLGASGMLGFALHRGLHDQGYEVQGAIRRVVPPTSSWTKDLQYQFGADANEIGTIRRAIDASEASIVINAAGVIKQVDAAKDQSKLLHLNSVFPTRLEIAGETDGFRLIHFSTDCVFTGQRGRYSEADIPDAEDAYGLSKLLGEVTRSALTLRTSIIGRGLSPNGSLVDWFLSQTGPVRTYPKAFFSGLPVNAIADFIGRDLIPRLAGIRGLYHLAAERIDKATLLGLVSKKYNRNDISFVPDISFSIDRSLDGSALQLEIAHNLPDWPTLIDNMYNFYAALGSRAAETE